MARVKPLPSAATIAAAAVTVAVLFAAAVVTATRILPALDAEPANGSVTVPATPVTASDSARWAGVAQLNGSCTGALLDSGTPSGPAYLLTAGHCTPVGDADASVVLRAEPLQGEAEFEKIAGQQPQRVPVVETTYATMKGTDLAIVRLGATQAELQSRGISAYRLARTAPGAGLAVTNVAVPINGVATRDVVLRKGSCTTGPRADLVELGWHFDRMISNDCPGVLGGSSGSPLFDAEGAIVGVITTTTGGALPGGACYLNAPCERTADGVRMVTDRSYAAGVAGLASCFSAGRFALGAACPLPTPALSLRVGQRTFTSAAVSAHGGVPLALVAPRPTPVRVGVAKAVDRPVCEDPATYTASGTATPVGAETTLRLPTTEGVYFACVASGSDLRDAAVAVYSIDDTPPVRIPRLSVINAGDGYAVEPVFSVPELADYVVKIGPEASTSCADPTGYQRYRRIKLDVSASDLPARVCLIGSDLAGNRGQPWGEVLPKR